MPEDTSHYTAESFGNAVEQENEYSRLAADTDAIHVATETLDKLQRRSEKLETELHIGKTLTDEEYDRLRNGTHLNATGSTRISQWLLERFVKD